MTPPMTTLCLAAAAAASLAAAAPALPATAKPNVIMIVIDGGLTARLLIVGESIMPIAALRALEDVNLFAPVRRSRV
eukprot:SAG31_NODE_2856_length_4992_cov_2.079910_7_plen_77_part_00